MKKIKQHSLVLSVTVFALCFLLSSFRITATSSSNTEIDSYYLSEKSNVDTIHATTAGALPCIGEAKVLVFYTDFKDGSPNWSKTKEEVENMFFSDTGKNNPSVAYSEEDSLRSYYYRSSYGKVDITGTVYEYQTQKSTSYYDSLYNVLDEILAYYRDIINWNDYDRNNDGYIDGIYVIARNKHSWGGPNFVGSLYLNPVDDKKISKACFLDSPDICTLLHETCHMFGPADMYSGVSVNPSGIHTACIMENGYGDLPSATKFILGWIDNPIFVSSDNVGQYKLRSYTNYGDVLIVFPNGDPSNRNWFFVEYVTNEGNNCEYGDYKYGIRVWKTQMYIDENFDIIGAKEYCNGMPNSPYEYLEAIHPDGVYNYYMQVGDEITPYTYPSTSYSDTFYNIGGAKFLSDLTFSGINISFVKTENDVATVNIQIEEHANLSQSANVDLVTFSTDEYCTYLDNIDYVHFATLTSDRELKISSPIKLVSPSSGDTFTLETEKSQNSCEIRLYITPEMINLLKERTDWKISASGITTYYGAAIDIKNTAYTLDFSNYPKALIDCNEQYSTYFNMSFEYNMKFFKISDSIILTIYFDDIANKLYWGEINIETNTTETFELSLPENIVLTEWLYNDCIRVWHDYDAYFVIIDDYICCYRDKTLITYADLLVSDHQYLSFKGSDENSFFIGSNNKIYKMLLSDNLISFETIDVDISDISTYEINNIFNFVKNQYVVSTINTVKFADIEKNIVKDIIYDNDNDSDWTDNAVYYINNNYYVFSSGVDFIMYKYDTEFNLLRETRILNNLTYTIWGPLKIKINYINNSWFIYFESISKSNAISYSNSYLIICAENGQILHYYKYGDATFRHVCEFIPVSPYKILTLTVFTIGYIRTDCEQHLFDEWTQTLAPTCTEPGARVQNCIICGATVNTDTIAALGHDWKNNTLITLPNPNYNGMREYYCTRCQEAKIEIIPYTSNDINIDGKLDKSDAEAILSHITRNEIEVNTNELDINNDGDVNIRDAAMILLYLSGKIDSLN